MYVNVYKGGVSCCFFSWLTLHEMLGHEYESLGKVLAVKLCKNPVWVLYFNKNLPSQCNKQWAALSQYFSETTKSSITEDKINRCTSRLNEGHA